MEDRSETGALLRGGEYGPSRVAGFDLHRRAELKSSTPPDKNGPQVPGAPVGPLSRAECRQCIILVMMTPTTAGLVTWHRSRKSIQFSLVHDLR